MWGRAGGVWTPYPRGSTPYPCIIFPPYPRSLFSQFLGAPTNGAPLSPLFMMKIPLSGGTVFIFKLVPGMQITQHTTAGHSPQSQSSWRSFHSGYPFSPPFSQCQIPPRPRRRLHACHPARRLSQLLWRTVSHWCSARHWPSIAGLSSHASS